MKTNRRIYGQAGGIGSLAAIVALSMALLLALTFGVWAKNGKNSAQSNLDQKIAAAVAVASQQAADAQKTKDANAAKQPVETYTGSDTYGGVKFDYPRTWDGFVDTTDSSNPIKAFYYQGSPPLQNDSGILYALRVELVSDDYASVINSQNTNVKKGLVTATAYVPPKMVNIQNVQTGTKFDGQIEKNITGSMAILKVRDKTLKIYTESPTYLSDFNNIVLASLLYVP